MPKRLKFVVLTIGSLLLLLAFASGAAAVTGNEQIWTDKPDYAAVESAIISGSGFEPIWPITIKITAPDSTVFTHNLTTQTNGTFTYNYPLNGISGTYLVEAIDQVFGIVLATTTFTESPSAIWTTNETNTPQDYHFFFTGGKLWLHGDGLNANATLNYEITDGTGGGAPVVHTGTVTTDANGDITPSPTMVWDIPSNYIIQGNGQFKIKVLSTPAKSDNFTLDYGAVSPLILDPPSDTNPTGTTHTVTVTAKDINGNPVQGVKIYFVVTGANANTGWATLPLTTWAASTPTDNNGQTTYTYTGNFAGLDMITATADSDNNGIADPGEPSGTASKTWGVPPASTLTLSPLSDSNKVGILHTVSATVSPNPGDGTPVHFTVTGANPTSGTAPTSGGVATFQYLGTNPGTDVISAYADINLNPGQDSQDPSEQQQAFKHWYLLDLTPSSAGPNPVGTQHTVTATLTPPQQNIPVYFTVSGANSPTSGMVLTNASGVATFTYTGNNAGPDSISAYADVNAIPGQQDPDDPSAGPVSKTWEVRVATTITLTPSSDSNPIGTSHTVTAHVKDQFGASMGNISVFFQVTVTNPNQGWATAPSTSWPGTVTDLFGNTTYTYSGANAGPDTIKATADANSNGTAELSEPSNTATKNWQTPPQPSPPTGVNSSLLGLGAFLAMALGILLVRKNPIKFF